MLMAALGRFEMEVQSATNHAQVNSNPSMNFGSGPMYIKQPEMTDDGMENIKEIPCHLVL